MIRSLPGSVVAAACNCAVVSAQALRRASVPGGGADWSPDGRELSYPGCAGTGAPGGTGGAGGPALGV
ncbi:hypothetical protein ACWCXB_06740 [Streptomyces sp. NPDC001514]